MNTNVLTRVECDRDLVYLWLGDKSRTTQVSYSSIVTGFFDFINKPLSEVAIEDLQLWHRRLRITDKPSTVANKIRAIKSLFSYGVKVGYLEINVGSYIKCPKVKEKLAQRILSESDCLKLISATKSDRNRALLCLMYGCGLRVSEVCALTWDDLQSHGRGGKCNVFGKGAKTRVVLVPLKVWELIMKQPKLIDVVFVSRTGRPLERTMIFKIVKACAKRAGVSEKASCHWLRHSHASHAIESGCNLRLLQKSLGHSKLTIGSWETDCEELSEDEQLAVWKAEEEDLQIQDNIGDELSGNIQWQVLKSESDWHKTIIEQDKDLPLRLSVEESELAKHYGHLLLSGSAGTGKTTVGLYRLLKSLETLPAGKRLYVAYNPILVKETSKQFQNLVGSEIKKIKSWFQFQTIQDLCSQILLQAGKIYIEYDEVDYQVFERLYCRQSISRTYPAALVWDEIRSIIKGSCLKTDVRLFSLTKYEALGKNQSSVIAQEERPNIYRIAQWYQRYLTTNKRFDEIDLARDALEYIQQRQHERYQMIVCDEVQDLTELQLHLLMQLLAPDGHLFFAGDLNQMISPRTVVKSH